MAFTDCNIMDYRPLKCQSAQVSNISQHEAFTLLILRKPLRAQGSSASMIHLSPITSGDYENCLIPHIDYKQVHDGNGK